MKTKLTRILMLALSLMLLAGTSAAAANGPHTDDEMGGIGGLPSDVDPADHESPESVGEWLDRIGPVLGGDLLSGWTPEYAPIDGERGPWGPGQDPTPTGGEDDDTTECEKNPDSLACKSETCDALDDELNEAWEDRDDMTDEERELSLIHI